MRKKAEVDERLFLSSVESNVEMIFNEALDGTLLDRSNIRTTISFLLMGRISGYIVAALMRYIHDSITNLL